MNSAKMLNKADKILTEQAMIEANWSEAEKAFFEKGLSTSTETVGTETVSNEKPVTMKKQQVSLTWAQIVKFNINSTSFPYVDNYTHLITRVVKNVTNKDNNMLQGEVKMGGVSLKVVKDSRFENDHWEIEGLA